MPEAPVPLPPLLHLTPIHSNSQDLDSGLGRTDESSEHDLLGGLSSACNTDATNTPESTRKFCLGHSLRSGFLKPAKQNLVSLDYEYLVVVMTMPLELKKERK